MMLSLFMCETFIRLCEERTGVGLHLSLDYLRKLFFFRVKNVGVVTLSQFLAVQPNIMTSVKN